MASLSGCAASPHKPPIEDVYLHDHPMPLHLGSFFALFQNSFLSIVLFILLFTLFMGWQSRRRDYFCYALYLFLTWVYFARNFPAFFYPFFPDEPSYLVFKNFLRPTDEDGGFSYQTEVPIFSFLSIAYLWFVSAFFDLKNRAPLAHKVTRWTNLLLLVLALLQIIALVLSHGKDYLPILPEILVKVLFFLPAVWLMVQVIRTRLPGAVYIVAGSAALLLGSLFVGYLHVSSDMASGRRVYLQMGVLMEILCFSAALGRKDFDLQQQFLATALEKQRIELEKRQTEKRENRQRRKTRRQQEQIQDLQMKLQKKYKGSRPPSDEESFPEKLERILEQYHRDPEFRVANLAEAMGMAHNTLYRQIKDLYQLSIEGYLCSYRLEKSKALMRNRHLSLKEIAFRAGFHQYEHFSAMFKRKEGVSPRKFREKMGQNA